jgi:hypothetical protein
LREEVEVVEEDYDGVFGDGLMERRGYLNEGVVICEGVCADVGADDGDEAFGGDVVYCQVMVVSIYFFTDKALHKVDSVRGLH